MAHEQAHVRQLLYRYYAFQDCILESIGWSAGGAVLEFRSNYLWSDEDGLTWANGVPKMREGKLREDLDSPLIRVLSLVGVQELHVQNWLLDGHIEALEGQFPGEGWSEVAGIDLERSSGLLPAYRQMRTKFNHLVCWLGGDRRIDAVFHSAIVTAS